MRLRGSIKSNLAVLTLLMFMLSLVSIAPVQAAGLTFRDNGIPASSELISNTEAEVLYRITDPIDPENVYLKWNFSNGMDAHLKDSLDEITLKNKDTDEIITLNKEIGESYKLEDNTNTTIWPAGDFKYTKKGGGDGSGGELRQLELITTLQPSTNYIIILGPGMASNNGNTLGKPYSWEFTASSDSLDLKVAPVLSADISNNTVGQTVYLTFTDDSAWRELIEEVRVAGDVLESEKYQLDEGQITINAGVFTEAGDYIIAVKATGYKDTAVTQTMNIPPGTLETPPTLAADASNTLLGDPIDITFIDDAAWRDALADVLVNGTSIKDKYTVGEGQITINAEVFPKAGSYEIVVKATGYEDAFVMQTISVLAVFLYPYASPNGVTSGIEVDRILRVGFGNPLNEAGIVKIGEIKLNNIDAEGNRKPVEFSYTLNQDKLLIIQPAGNLEYGADYELILPAGIEDIAGNIGKESTLLFKTLSFEKPLYKITQGEQTVETVKPGEKYRLTATIINASAKAETVKAILQLRGGKGARQEQGGDVLAQNSQIIMAESKQPSDVILNFEVPADIDSPVIYGDIFIWEDNCLNAKAKPAYFSCPVVQ